MHDILEHQAREAAHVEPAPSPGILTNIYCTVKKGLTRSIFGQQNPTKIKKPIPYNMETTPNITPEIIRMNEEQESDEESEYEEAVDGELYVKRDDKKKEEKRKTGIFATESNNENNHTPTAVKPTEPEMANYMIRLREIVSDAVTRLFTNLGVPYIIGSRYTLDLLEVINISLLAEYNELSKYRDITDMDPKKINEQELIALYELISGERAITQNEADQARQNKEKQKQGNPGKPASSEASNEGETNTQYRGHNNQNNLGAGRGRSLHSQGARRNSRNEYDEPPRVGTPGQYGDFDRREPGHDYNRLGESTTS